MTKYLGESYEEEMCTWVMLLGPTVVPPWLKYIADEADGTNRGRREGRLPTSLLGYVPPPGSQHPNIHHLPVGSQAANQVFNTGPLGAPEIRIII